MEKSNDFLSLTDLKRVLALLFLMSALVEGRGHERGNVVSERYYCV